MNTSIGWKPMKTMSSNPLVHPGENQCLPPNALKLLRLRNAALLRLRSAKITISLFVAFSALTGYAVQAHRLDITALFAFAGMMLLAAGSATINNIQDRKIDRQFSRTAHRPLACGALSVSQGKRQSIALLSAGCLLLYLATDSPWPLLLGITGVVCYNLLYTPLKFRTLWAIVPGVICGMIPPLVGWIAAGGQLGSPRIWLIMILLGLWQPPHAWLIMLANADELPTADSRNILSFFSTFQVSRILFIWVCSFMAVLSLLPAFGILAYSFYSTTLVLAGGLAAGWYAWGLFKVRTRKTYRYLFTLLNSVLALTMLYCLLENINAAAI